jgi:hypothetical protein
MRFGSYFRDGARVDFHEADDQIARAHGSCNADLRRRYRSLACTILRRAWPAVVALAAELRARRRMTGRAVVRTVTRALASRGGEQAGRARTDPTRGRCPGVSGLRRRARSRRRGRPSPRAPSAARRPGTADRVDSRRGREAQARLSRVPPLEPEVPRVGLDRDASRGVSVACSALASSSHS